MNCHGGRRSSRLLQRRSIRPLRSRRRAGPWTTGGMTVRRHLAACASAQRSYCGDGGHIHDSVQTEPVPGPSVLPLSIPFRAPFRSVPFRCWRARPKPPTHCHGETIPGVPRLLRAAAARPADARQKYRDGGRPADRLVKGERRHRRSERHEVIAGAMCMSYRDAPGRPASRFVGGRFRRKLKPGGSHCHAGIDDRSGRRSPGATMSRADLRVSRRRADRARLMPIRAAAPRTSHEGGPAIITTAH